jgi:hypothetical protein
MIVRTLLGDPVMLNALKSNHDPYIFFQPISLFSLFTLEFTFLSSFLISDKILKLTISSCYVYMKTKLAAMFPWI